MYSILVYRYAAQVPFSFSGPILPVRGHSGSEGQIKSSSEYLLDVY